MKKRVVITGLGIVSPIGTGKDHFLKSLYEGTSGIKFIEELQKLNFGCQIGGIPDISNSKYNSHINQFGLHTSSKIIIYSVIAGLEAWEDANLNIPDRESETDFDTGIIIGSGIGSADIFGERIVPYTNEGKIKNLRSTIVEHSMLSGPSANLAGILALGNQISFNSSACSTGTEAIIMGYERIASGFAKRMVVGAVDAYSPYCWSGFDAMHVTTRKHNNNPVAGSRPMSETASGFVPGSGSGIIILEEFDSASKRGATIYAELAGGYINSGGQRNGGTMSAPSAQGVIRCLQGAIRNAAIDPDNIDCIAGHLSSTMADVIEIKNWIETLNRKGKNFPYINSLKSMTGHCIGAAGALETIAGILEIKHDFIHATINCEDLHPEISNLISESKVPHATIVNKKVNLVAKSSFGFGDVNACLILKKI